jgi:hypothetical protein
MGQTRLRSDEPVAQRSTRRRIGGDNVRHDRQCASLQPGREVMKNAASLIDTHTHLETGRRETERRPGSDMLLGAACRMQGNGSMHIPVDSVRPVAGRCG